MQAIINVSEDLFRYLFKAANRENNFSHEGLGLLYQHLKSQEVEGKPQTLNIHNLCMTYGEEVLEDFVRCWSLEYEYLCENREKDGERGEETALLLKKCILEFIVESNSYVFIGFTENTVIYSCN